MFLPFQPTQRSKLSLPNFKSKKLAFFPLGSFNPDLLRSLLEARENFSIQSQAVELASNRVESAELFLQAGRAEMRDVLDAQESLVSAQKALTTALVNYRVSELELQRDMGVLEVDHKGVWSEYRPGKTE